MVGHVVSPFDLSRTLLVGGKVKGDVSEILVIDLLVPTIRESTLTETAHPDQAP